MEMLTETLQEREKTEKRDETNGDTKKARDGSRHKTNRCVRHNICRSGREWKIHVNMENWLGMSVS